ncbi:MAG TPA: helix-turn-helix domain-containing protein [Candidatus Limnocylindrales bacterium]|nr:helix-turn-helix domain-containing protein [Candidatus Limnocylindrales bacterium]
MPNRTTRQNPDWISLSEASRVLGVSPATLRRWSDAGRLRVFTTPGGHRRFSRDALERLLPGDRSRRPSIGGSLTPSRIARTYRRASREVAPELPWVLTLTDEQRALFRERGHLLAASLLQYLDAAQPDAAAMHLAEAGRSATDYGTVAAGMGLSLSQTVEGFLRFRAPFHQELAIAARRRGFDTTETTDLLQTAERAMDQLLIATMTGHGRVPARRGGRAATTEATTASRGGR